MNKEEKIDESKIPKLEFLQNLFSYAEGPGWKYIGNECVVRYDSLLYKLKELIASNGNDPWCEPMREFALLFGQYLTGKSKDEMKVSLSEWSNLLKIKPIKQK